jgi:hypothetical protein
MDSNGDGFVSKAEMLSSSSNLTKEQVDAVFRRNDENGDGKLSKEEFKDMIRRNAADKSISRFPSSESVASSPGSSGPGSPCGVRSCRSARWSGGGGGGGGEGGGGGTAREARCRSTSLRRHQPRGPGMGLGRSNSDM